jgi:hypothetical protein
LNEQSSYSSPAQKELHTDEVSSVTNWRWEDMRARAVSVIAHGSSNADTHLIPVYRQISSFG